MKIEPVKGYEPPEYAPFEMKTNVKIAAGLACIAMLAGLSGCAFLEEIHDVPKVQTTFVPERLDGVVASVTPEPEMLLGEIEYYTPAPTDIEALDGDVAYTPATN